MSLKEHFCYMYSDKFWYSKLDYEALGRCGVDLYASVAETEKPIIWHLAHIVHKEEVHIGQFLEHPRRRLLHPELNRLVMAAEGIEAISDLIPNLEFIVAWHKKVRAATLAFIGSLSADDFFAVPEGSPKGLCIADWLAITQVHTGVHFGRVDGLIKILQSS